MLLRILCKNGYKEGFFMKKNVLILSSLIMLAGLTACGRKISTAEASEAEKTVTPEAEIAQSPSPQTVSPEYMITVNSSEHISVVPDIAEVVYSVRTKADTASGCHQKNAESVDQVITLLKSLGISETSIQTSDYNMNPVYNYNSGSAVLTGYEAITTLTVSDLPIDELDDILAQSVSSGINTVQSITYQASKYDEGYQEALKKAVASAYEKAQVLAAASGASVGRVVSIQEVSGYSDARYTDYARSNQINNFSYAKEEALADTAGMMPGEVDVEAKIIVEYQLVY